MASSSNGDFPDATKGEQWSTGEGANDGVPRPKRIACILCRKRKLRCDGNKPSCGTCSRLSHNCEYNEERKKSGPKRGYVKLLEARLKQVENLLETRDVASDAPAPAKAAASTTTSGRSESGRVSNVTVPIMTDTNMMGLGPDAEFIDPSLNAQNDFNMNTGDDFSWEMIGLGLEEALPNREVVDELNEIYFDKIHPSLPMIHRGRFLAAMDLAPHLRPAVCLRYAMWTHACCITPKFSSYADHFYQRARKYAEQDEMRGHGESMITVNHSQCWTLLACYEFRVMYFPRAWMSIGRAARLALMMGLHRQDRVGLDVKQTLPPPRDWTDREERRRTFWMAFCQDRYGSVGTGWPMVIDEQDILTNLPATEDAFNKGQQETTLSLTELMAGVGAATLSPFGGVILMSTIYGRNLTHLHRPIDSDNDSDLNGTFWKRHRQLDNVLLNTALSIPPQLRLPAGLSEPNTIFVNMNIHTATICLHQAAIFKADKNRLPAQISAESKRRCIVAADQITNIMKMISHLDMSLMNPFMAFCLYVAARVFVQYLKARKDDAAVKSSLHFLLAAMQVLKAKNPLTESFLAQLDVDLEGTGLDILTSSSRWNQNRCRSGESQASNDDVKCSPLMEIRETQGHGMSQGPNTQGHSPAPAPQQGFNSKLPHTLWPSADPHTDGISPSNPYPSLYGSDNNLNPSAAQSGADTLAPNSASSYGFPVAHSVGASSSPGGFSNQDSHSRPQSNHPTPSAFSTNSGPNASGSSHTSYTSPPSHMQQPSPTNNYNHLFADNTWSVPQQAQMGQPVTTQQEFDFSGGNVGGAGATMMPMMDVNWGNGMDTNQDWIFGTPGWPGDTPQPG